MDINIELVNSEGGRTALLEGIPSEVWNSFAERAKELRQDIENPALAPYALLVDIINSVANVDQRVIMLRDIPPTEYHALAEKCLQANTDISALISDLIVAASKDRLFLGRYAKRAERDGKQVWIRGRNVILLSGVTDSAIKPFLEIFKHFGVSVVEIFMRFFEALEAKQIKMRVFGENKEMDEFMKGNVKPDEVVEDVPTV